MNSTDIKNEQIVGADKLSEADEKKLYDDYMEQQDLIEEIEVALGFEEVFWWDEDKGVLHYEQKNDKIDEQTKKHKEIMHNIQQTYERLTGQPFDVLLNKYY